MFHHDVRTTLTIDDDVAHLLQKETRRSGSSFKETVNHYLRLGLTSARRQHRKPFVVTPRKMGLPANVSYDNVAELIDILEGAEHR